MTPIQQIEADVKVAVPEATLKPRQFPLSPEGAQWLDITHKRRELTVEWRPSTGFGLHIPVPYGDDVGFTGPEELFATESAITKRIIELLVA